MSTGAGSRVAGRYSLVRQLGRGGMGVVWQAHDEVLDRPVAIKEVQFGDLPYQRTVREARAAARLRHPGIVTVHDVVLHDERPWIVMELIEGPSLAELVRDNGPLAPERAIKFAGLILDALDTAHRAGVLHRDVKPANVLIEGDRVVLTDFGIAAMDDATALTASGQLIGSPEYIAPERIAGQPAAAAADLWALGATLYTLSAGTSPFRQENPAATFVAVLTRDPDPIPQSALWPVIAGLLRRDPAERLTVEGVRELLQTVSPAPEQLEPEPVVPAEPAPTLVDVPQTLPATRLAASEEPPEELPIRPAAPAPRRLSRKDKILVAAALLAAIVVVTAVIWLPGQFSGAGSALSSAHPTETPASPSAPATSTTTTTSTTTPPPPPPPGYVPFQDFGYSLAAPEGTTRGSSGGIGTLYKPAHWPELAYFTTYRQDKPETGSARAVLEAYEAALKPEPGQKYSRIRLVELAPETFGNAAELEYTSRERLNIRDPYHHELQRTVIGKSGSAYTLTFTVMAGSAAAAEADWAKIAPEVTIILSTFTVS